MPEGKDRYGDRSGRERTRLPGERNGMAERRAQPVRTLIALAWVLAVIGAVLIGFALIDQAHPPQPSKSAQAAPLAPITNRSSTPTPAKPSPTHPPLAPPPVTSRRATASVPAPTPPPLPPLQSGLTLPTSQPVQLSIPAIGVSTTIMNLGLNPDSTVQTPPLSRNSVAGWYEFSPTPGSVGAAVLLGHVDSAAYGAGVFYRLGALDPGAEIDVQRQDGTTAVFRVDRVAEYPKTQFPTDLVYGQTSYAALRLVTCGGSFDASTRNYRDNIIAFASLIAARRT